MAGSRKKKGMTYAEAGVDIDLKSKGISALVSKLGTGRDGKTGQLEIPGHFTGLLDFGEYALSLCTDGVGTKLLIAERLNVWDTVGIDCIAMNVNDTICVGAEPIGFVDYIAVDEVKPNILEQIGEGLRKGAELANVSIVGGEVAIMPEIINGTDLTGTCLGIVKKKDIITGEHCRPGDAIIGLASSGIHSNGLTLARKILSNAGIDLTDRIDGLGDTIGSELLIPTRIYVREILEGARRFDIHGMINITGGGVRNFLRLKKGLGFRIEDPIMPQPIFNKLQEIGSVDDEEMYQTFNMGLGFSIIAPDEDSKDLLSNFGEDAKIIGRVDDSGKVAIPSLELEYERY